MGRGRRDSLEIWCRCISNIRYNAACCKHIYFCETKYTHTCVLIHKITFTCIYNKLTSTPEFGDFKTRQGVKKTWHSAIYCSVSIFYLREELLWGGGAPLEEWYETLTEKEKHHCAFGNYEIWKVRLLILLAEFINHSGPCAFMHYLGRKTRFEAPLVTGITWECICRYGFKNSF